MITVLTIEYAVFFCLLIYLKISKQNKIAVSFSVIAVAGLICVGSIYFHYWYNKQSIKERDGIVTSSGRVYELREGLKPGDKAYIDRTYEFTDIPADVAGEQFIKTANEDKMSIGNNFLQITLLYPAVVYVGFDIRGEYQKLSWLKEFNFELTNDTVTTTDTRFVLYKKEFDECPKVILGGNVLPGANDIISMYIVILDHNYNKEVGNVENCGKDIKIDTSGLRKTLQYYVKSEYPGATLNTNELINRIVSHDKRFNSDSLTARSRADFTGMNLSHVMMREVNLSYSDMHSAVMDSADIVGINLSNSELLGVDFKGARMQRADLSNAGLMNADLSNAKLNGADMHNVDLSDAKLDKADLTLANLSGVIFEPTSLPDLRAIANADSLAFMRYNSFPDALVKLRLKFTDEGYKLQAKEITSAIEKEKTRRAGFFEKYFRIIFFEITSSYGLQSGKPLLLIIGLMFFFYPLYVFSLISFKNSELIKDYDNKSVPITGTKDEDFPRRFFQSVFHFSLLNAFSMGWNDFQVGNWIANIQFTQYKFRANGVTRSLAGIQALMSFYLLVLWVLTYFGNPFT